MNQKRSTDHRRRTRLAALWLPCAVLGVLTVLGGYYAAFGVGAADFHRWADLSRSEPLGKLPAAVEQDFNQRFLAGQAARTLVLGIDLPVLHPRGPDRITSPSGMVFLREDIDLCHTVPLLSRENDRASQALVVLGALADRLRERGTTLIIVPVPSKASICAPEIDPNYDVSLGADLNEGHARWMSAAAARGIEVFDPTEILWGHRDETMFFKTDTHWSPRTMDLVASALAPRIEAALGPAVPRVPFQTRAAKYSYRGDVSENPHPDQYDIHADYIQLVEDGRPLSFGDEAEVLVTGDSNAEQLAPQSGAFAHLLASHTGMPVQNDAVIGIQASRMVSRLDVSLPPVRNKKVVVLVFAIRKLVCNDWTPEAYLHP